jgi:hypothetical protein
MALTFQVTKTKPSAPSGTNIEADATENIVCGSDTGYYYIMGLNGATNDCKQILTQQIDYVTNPFLKSFCVLIARDGGTSPLHVGIIKGDLPANPENHATWYEHGQIELSQVTSDQSLHYAICTLSTPIDLRNDYYHIIMAAGGSAQNSWLWMTCTKGQLWPYFFPAYVWRNWIGTGSCGQTPYWTSDDCTNYFITYSEQRYTLTLYTNPVSCPFELIGWGSATTDSTGYYLCEYVAAGPHHLTVYKPPYAPYDEEIYFNANIVRYVTLEVGGDCTGPAGANQDEVCGNSQYPNAPTPGHRYKCIGGYWIDQYEDPNCPVDTHICYGCDGTTPIQNTFPATTNCGEGEAANYPYTNYQGCGNGGACAGLSKEECKFPCLWYKDWIWEQGDDGSCHELQEAIMKHLPVIIFGIGGIIVLYALLHKKQPAYYPYYPPPQPPQREE